MIEEYPLHVRSYAKIPQTMNALTSLNFRLQQSLDSLDTTVAFPCILIIIIIFYISPNVILTFVSTIGLIVAAVLATFVSMMGIFLSAVVVFGAGGLALIASSLSFILMFFSPIILVVVAILIGAGLFNLSEQSN